MIVGGLVAAAVAAVAVGLASGGSDEVGTGPAPAFRLENLDEGGEAVGLAPLRGRPVVLNFWASWCVPCRNEMPAFERVHHDFGDRVAFVGINNRDSRRLARQLARETGVTYPSGYDPDGRLERAYRLVGMPTTVFIDAAGRMVGRHAGEISETDLRDEVERLLEAELP